MEKVKKQQEDVLKKDIVLDGIGYGFEYYKSKEEIILYIPQIVIFCKAERLAKLYPEFAGMELGALYPAILEYVASHKTQPSKSINKGSVRFVPDALRVYDLTFSMTYDRSTDELLMILPPRSIVTDLITVDKIYPELLYMHNGNLLDLIKYYITNCSLDVTEKSRD